MAKRPLDEVEEFVEVGDVTHPSQNAKIHGVVNSLSPMKKSRNCAYFDGEISDGKASLRIFGFDSAVRSWQISRKAAVQWLCRIARLRSPGKASNWRYS